MDVPTREELFDEVQQIKNSIVQDECITWAAFWQLLLRMSLWVEREDAPTCHNLVSSVNLCYLDNVRFDRTLGVFTIVRIPFSDEQQCELFWEEYDTWARKYVCEDARTEEDSPNMVNHAVDGVDGISQVWQTCPVSMILCLLKLHSDDERDVEATFQEFFRGDDQSHLLRHIDAMEIILRYLTFKVDQFWGDQRDLLLSFPPGPLGTLPKNVKDWFEVQDKERGAISRYSSQSDYHKWLECIGRLHAYCNPEGMDDPEANISATDKIVIAMSDIADDMPEDCSFYGGSSDYVSRE